jgi:hypothetical protein
VTFVEMLDQVLAPFDREFARLVEGYLKRHGVYLALSDNCKLCDCAFSPAGQARTTIGERCRAKAYSAHAQPGRDAPLVRTASTRSR